MIVRAFDGTGSGLLQVGKVNVSVTTQSGDNSIRIRDVGANVLRRTPDGSLLLSISGQVPFGWKGVLREDGDTFEVILEPKPSTDLERVCAALTG